jgi:hypothetical protein
MYPYTWFIKSCSKFASASRHIKITNSTRSYASTNNRCHPYSATLIYLSQALAHPTTAHTHTRSVTRSIIVRHIDRLASVRSRFSSAVGLRTVCRHRPRRHTSHTHTHTRYSTHTRTSTHSAITKTTISSTRLPLQLLPIPGGVEV